MRKCYTIMALLAVLALGLFAGAALAAGSDKPPAPPGQGECAHGNSGKPCKEDPQPEKGKDCEEHGPKEGGVNEDHCKGTTPPPPPPTTTTDTTTTEEEPSTTETTSTTPSPQETTPDEPSSGNDGTTPPSQSGSDDVSKPTLEEQLEEQASQNGASTAGPTGHAAAPDELPYTGFETWMAVLIGLGLSGAGLALRRWAK